MTTNLDRLASLVRHPDRWVIPICALGAWIGDSKSAAFHDALMRWLLEPAHGLGRALTRLLAGNAPFPVPPAVASVQFQDRQLIVILGVILVHMVLLRVLWRMRLVFAATLALASMLLQFYLSFRVGAQAVEMWVTFGGVVGVFIGAALAMVLPFRRPASGSLSDLVKYAFVVPGTLLMTAAGRMLAVLHSNPQLPWAGAERELPSGIRLAVMKLHSEFGWHVESQLKTAAVVACICIAVATFNYLIVAWCTEPGAPS